jgi:uncharacterized protein (DUF1697 family)
MRYAAFLRAVSPMNARMPDLRNAFEAAGFRNVKTLLSSGNVVFDAAKASEASLQRKAEAAMTNHLGKSFLTIVRSVDALRELVASDPYENFRLAPNTKRVVTFLRNPPISKIVLPVKLGSARILAMSGTEIFSVYVPHEDDSPLFMSLIDKTFGKEVTTRTWETVTKAAKS